MMIVFFFFQMSTLLKTSNPGKHQEPLVFKAYSSDIALCVVRCFKQYLKKKEGLRNGEDQLWLEPLC